MVSSLHKKWSCISRLLPCGSISAEKIFPIIKECIIDIENCGLRVQVISTDNYPLNVNLFKLFSLSGKLETRVPHPFDPTRFLFLTFDFVHILKSIRNNWLNQKNFDKTMYFPKLEDFEIDKCQYPLCLHSASFPDVRLLYSSERGSLAKLAPQLTAKACFPSSIERQNVRLILKKIFNVSTPFKGIRLNDNLSTPLISHDERFIYLARIVYWLDAWQSLPGKSGKLSKQTYTSLRHACIALEQRTNYLTESCGFSYVLSAFLPTDPLEHHFGLYRMMAGSIHHISYIQILESVRRLKLSNILKMFSDQRDPCQSIHTFVKSFTSPFSTSSDDQIDLEPYLDRIGDVLSIEYTQQILQSLACIGGYSVYKFLKGFQECRLYTDTLTYDKEFIPDSDSISQFKLLQFTDRGGLKYPSEHVLSSVITLWRILFAIEDNDHLANLLVHGPPRKILVELTLIYMKMMQVLISGNQTVLSVMLLDGISCVNLFLLLLIAFWPTRLRTIIHL
ncbi:Transposable element P transposase [Oopsacas minuta]|uniref:Transposable element P transposase n=1 Tax=Oopsacas minuta TaxID=111878 RepID=A0AAV7JK03_9METZ|nr:Transposable element P transposase [Oopsacas minuta]